MLSLDPSSTSLSSGNKIKLVSGKPTRFAICKQSLSEGNRPSWLASERRTTPAPLPCEPSGWTNALTSLTLIRAGVGVTTIELSVDMESEGGLGSLIIIILPCHFDIIILKMEEKSKFFAEKDFCLEQTSIPIKIKMIQYKHRFRTSNSLVDHQNSKKTKHQLNHSHSRLFSRWLNQIDATHLTTQTSAKNTITPCPYPASAFHFIEK